ncbi:toluene tolerance protein [Betaproteobacteria bacterium GR16-43]|nr:toluene tolerance protein [Betaproteobacteria bacterium GR16-43]
MYRTLIAAFAALATSAALAQEAPDALVKKGVDDVLSAIKNDKDLQAGNLDKVMKLAEEKVLPNFDMTRMTRLAVGRPWAQATDAQKEALTKEFKTLIVRTYSSSLSQYRNQVVEVKPLKVAAGDTDVVVRTEVKQQGGPPIPLDYSMEKTDKGWKVYDVVVDGVSLVTTYRGSFGDIIQKSGVDGLVKALQERNARGGADPKAAPKK